MVIMRESVGAGKRRHDVYKLCNRPEATGADHPQELARFDTLELATIVMRYMRGDSLTESEEYRAKEAIKKTAAPTVESKRDRKAE